jgi:hypothetical protein
VAAAIALLQVVQSSSFAYRGQELQLLEGRQNQLSAEINVLEAEIAALSSLERTERAARERLGMVPALPPSYLAVDVEAPSGPLLPRPLVELTLAEPEPEPWWQSLLRGLSFH